MKPNSNTITTTQQALARLAAARALECEGNLLDAFRALTDIPSDLLFETPAALELCLSLAIELSAWGDGMTLVDQIQQERPLPVRMAAVEFLAGYDEHLLRLSNLAKNRSDWLMGPEREEDQQDDDDGDDDSDSEIQLEDVHPRRTDLN